jgi:hypothetical protein
LEWFNSKWRILALAMLVPVLGFVAYEDWARKDYAWRKGYLACIERGHQEPDCRRWVSKHNTQCFALTSTDQFFTSRDTEIMNVDLYIECIMEGPGPFRRMMRRERTIRRAETSTASFP